MPWHRSAPRHLAIGFDQASATGSPRRTVPTATTSAYTPTFAWLCCAAVRTIPLSFGRSPWGSVVMTQRGHGPVISRRTSSPIAHVRPIQWFRRSLRLRPSVDDDVREVDLLDALAELLLVRCNLVEQVRIRNDDEPPLLRRDSDRVDVPETAVVVELRVVVVEDVEVREAFALRHESANCVRDLERIVVADARKSLSGSRGRRLARLTPRLGGDG
jgi:hypothetical protein